MTGSLAHLAIAMAVFIGSHFLISSTPLRGWLVARMGEGAYAGLYSLIAALSLGWLIWAYHGAPYWSLWLPPLWTQHMLIGLMVPALFLAIVGIATRGPTSYGADATVRRPDPAPGIHQITRHPFLWGVVLWASGHLIANGDAGSMIFFGGFLVFAVAGTLLIDRKKGDRLGAAWERYAARTSNVPLRAIAESRAHWPSLAELGWWRVVLAIGIYGLVLWGHGLVIGVDPLMSLFRF